MDFAVGVTPVGPYNQVSINTVAKTMSETITIAIETSCRTGGVAIGKGAKLLKSVAFDTPGRHASELISQLDAMMRSVRIAPAEVDEVYVSAGPGSFTGLRVGITVARTLAQALGGIRCVAVQWARLHI